MNLHEYQAKRLFSEYGIPVPRGELARTADQAREIAGRLEGDAWVVKAQVHAGARGKGGGVKRVSSLEEVQALSERLLGSRLVTPQTDAVGLPVNAVLIEEGISIEREIYFGMLVDRELERITLMVSASGGMDIEEIAETDPEALLHIVVDPLVGLQPYQCRQICFDLGLGGELLDQLAQIMMGMYQLFIEKDLNLIEINPMVLTAEGRLLALDAKVDVDDNALFRQPLMEEMRDLTQEDEIEIRASRHGLNYITLDGNIACMVNGAGLAMATMDVIRLYGGYPANFLDVGGTTTPERVAEAIKIILSCSNVEALLINIFGGIVRCDLIAEGIILAHEEVGISIPLVVRVQGTHVERCHQLLEQSGLPLVMADDLTDAAKKVMSAVGQSVSEDAR